MPKRKSVRRGIELEAWAIVLEDCEFLLDPERSSVMLFDNEDEADIEREHWDSAKVVKVNVTEILPKRAKRKGKKNTKA